MSCRGRRSAIYEPAVAAPLVKAKAEEKARGSSTEKLTPRAITCLLRSFLSGYLSYGQVVARACARR